MSWKTILICGALLVGLNDALPRLLPRTKETEAEDLEGSATTYVYTKQQGLPVYYLQYTDHGSGPHYHAADAVQYVAPVAHAVPETTPILVAYATVGDTSHTGKKSYDENDSYGDEQLAKHAPLNVKPEPRAPYYHHEDTVTKEQHDEDGAHNDVGEGGTHGAEHDEDDNDERRDHADGGNSEKVYDGPDRSAKVFDSGDSYGYGDGGRSHGAHGDGDSSYEDGGGEKYENERHSEHGEQRDEGYKNYERFDKGEDGSHDDEDEGGHYSNEGGHKKGHDEESEEHDSHKEVEGSKKGSDYGHSSNYKKGQKINGFHNVYHKDDYKKETDFYDDDHEKGYFDRFEEFGKGYKEVEGDSKKGGHYSSGHGHGDHGKEGHYDKGHRQSQDRSDENEKGDQSYYEDHEDYGDEKESKSNNVHKYHKDS